LKPATIFESPFIAHLLSIRYGSTYRAPEPPVVYNYNKTEFNQYRSGQQCIRRAGYFPAVPRR